MKKILLFIILIFLSSSIVVAQNNFGRPYVPTTKHQKKNLRSFSSGKRHKRYIPFRKRSHVSHPTTTKKTKRILLRRHREQMITVR